MSKKELTFTEFLQRNYVGFSHGHDFSHDEIEGLYYRKEDIEQCEERYVDYQWNNFIAKLNPANKGLRHA